MRPITKIIIHCTATPEGRNVTVADVTTWHKQRGWQTIGYHYLIGLNGEMWTGRQIEQIGAHTSGQNANSIGVCYVGGVALDGKTAKDTRTQKQKEALKTLIASLKKKHPQASIHGHYEFANKACPCFDVQAWLKEIGL
jgi:N-acetylmuramoyl-L-alanine amidase.